MKDLKSLEQLINSQLTTKINSSVIKHNELKLIIDNEDLHNVILFIKNDSRIKFRQLIDITAVDYPENENRFKLIYFFCESRYLKPLMLNQLTFDCSFQISAIISIQFSSKNLFLDYKN